MSAIHFIGGEKGGVGKSVVARLCVQYCIDRGLPFVAADADASHGALMRFYADYATPIDLSDPSGPDQLVAFATEADRRVIVDLPAQSERMLGAWIAEAGILELAAESDVQVVFWHVIDDGKDSLVTLGRLLSRYGSRAKYCVVKNGGRAKAFSLFDESPIREQAAQLGAVVIELPELNATAMQKIDRWDSSFWAAIHGTSSPETFTRMERQRVKVWLQSAYDQIARGI